jgi:hypothetical protein
LLSIDIEAIAQKIISLDSPKGTRQIIKQESTGAQATFGISMFKT